MTHIKSLKYAINIFVCCAFLAFLATALGGGFAEQNLLHRIWIFPLRFELALVVLFLSLLAAYSLLYSSLHGRLLLTVIAFVHILNMILTTSVAESSVTALLSAMSMISLGGLLYLAWTNPQEEKVKRLRLYQRQRRRAKEEQGKLDYAYLQTVQHPDSKTNKRE
ncbi:hypothetical protein M0C34_19675 [Agarivorans sp. TSD2052]|uniref:hypothetical protein n=1 Tax=Agarivorans sp. TSD2052 TaxID=2937286 RepID=UPI00200F1C2C|nr:hypothetical protein [Agarivorans sp. TSD2052]UPW18416.1 hypothetical protein M0C34_19675 [Agarivorans sp. TSD2052]